MLRILTNLGRTVTATATFPFGWKEHSGGEIAIRDGQIVAVPWGEKVVPLAGEEAVVHDCGGKGLLLPGFVDSHTHLVYGGNRAHEFARLCSGETYREISATGGGIRYTVRQTRSASVAELTEGVKERLDRALRAGTTTIEIKASYGLEKNADLKQLTAIHKAASEFPGTVVATCLSAHEIPDEYLSDRSKYIELLCQEILPAVKEQGIATRADIYCEEKVFSVAEARLILTRAKDLGFELTMHADQWTNLGGAELAAELGVRSADHLEMTGDKELKALAKAGVVAGLLPGSVWFANSHTYPDYAKFKEFGIPVAVASDHNPGSSMVLEMPLVLTLAGLGCKLTGKDAIAASTLGGAMALGRVNESGSIEIGKRADLTLWDVEHEDEIAYRAGGVSPKRIIVGGKILS